MQISKLRCQEETAWNVYHDEKYLTVLESYEMTTVKQLERKGTLLCVLENTQGNGSLRKMADSRGKEGDMQNELVG